MERKVQTTITTFKVWSNAFFRLPSKLQTKLFQWLDIFPSRLNLIRKKYNSTRVMMVIRKIKDIKKEVSALPFHTLRCTNFLMQKENERFN